MIRNVSSLPNFIMQTGVASNATFGSELQGQQNIEEYFKNTFGGKIINSPDGALDVQQTLNQLRDKFKPQMIKYAEARIAAIRSKKHYLEAKGNNKGLFEQALFTKAEKADAAEADLAIGIESFLSRILSGKEKVNWLSETQLRKWAGAYAEINPLQHSNHNLYTSPGAGDALQDKIANYLEILTLYALEDLNPTLSKNYWNEFSEIPAEGPTVQRIFKDAAKPISQDFGERFKTQLAEF